MDREAALKKHYNAYATEYDGIKHTVEQILARLKPPPGSSILDLGCGTGALTFRLPEKGDFRRVSGLDLSEGVLDIAKKRAAELGLDNFEFHPGNACSLPFQNKEFDIVVSSFVLHLVSDLKKALSEVCRVLRPGGNAILQFPGGGDVAPETMAILLQAWNETLPDESPPQLFNKTSVEMVEQALSDLELVDFEISWLRKTQRIPEAQIANWLRFFRLIGGFWRLDLENEPTDQIEGRMTALVAQIAKREGYFTNTGNLLLIQFKKPE